jgi:hypothetical protein
LLVLAIALTLPAVQTRSARYFTESINKDFGTNISIDGCFILFFGVLNLKMYNSRPSQDTLVSRQFLNVLEGKKLDGDLIFDNWFKRIFFNVEIHKNEKIKLR